ncbi:alanine--tRNA ligase [Candidatus Daviesbacteria bacterium]|nr:alanine--tRNA ligase [Candidatus Daviesbacteria bacterium]
MDSKQIREKYIKFFVERGHKVIAAAKLVPENDSSTLFTSSGMQPLVPYLLGQAHPSGKRLVDSQPSFRAEDIEEVGDSRHTTYFEMLGNWSLGDYFKKEQLPWIWEFLTQELKLPKEKLYVTVFEGGNGVPKDIESFEIWKSLGVLEEHILFHGVSENWWSRSGAPDKMPAGEIGGPDSEVFYDFGNNNLLEIGNSVFIEYQKQDDGSLKELAQKNVDFGGGLERITAAVVSSPDVFQTDIYEPLLKKIEEVTGVKYADGKDKMQVIADHLRAAEALIADGVIPSNKLQGYVLRRLLRRSAVKLHLLNPKADLSSIASEKIVKDEIEKFGKTLDRGLKEIEKINQIDGKAAFDLYQTFGFPYEVTEELFRQKGQEINREQFREEFEKHKELSRTASSGMFKGGLADQSEIVTKYHTATHLLHQALRDVLGSQVFQKGSNITSERLRFDFSFDRKMTDEEIKQVEDLVNKKIAEDLKVERKIVSLEEAKKMGAIGLFYEKYKDKVMVYAIGNYSKEICGGPHVSRTGVIGRIKITKEEAISSGIRRIRAQIVLK